MKKIISLQGCMASGKTSVLKLMEIQNPEYEVNYEYSLPFLNKIKSLNENKHTEKGFIEIQKKWIEKEIERYSILSRSKKEIGFFDFGPEEVEFNTLYWPIANNYCWNVESILKDELENLRKCIPNQIIFLEGSNEILKFNKLQDLFRSRNSFSEYLNTMMPFKKEWIKKYPLTKFISIDNKTIQEIKNEIVQIIN